MSTTRQIRSGASSSVCGPPLVRRERVGNIGELTCHRRFDVRRQLRSRNLFLHPAYLLDQLSEVRTASP